MTMRTRSHAATALAILGLCACAPNPVLPPTATVPVPASDPNVVSLSPDVVRVSRPAQAASIQICLDLGPDAAASGPDNPALVLDAVAAELEILDFTSAELNHGLFLEVWSTASGAEGGGLLFSGEVPDLESVELRAGMSTEERNAALVEQDRQRQRTPAVIAAQSAMVESVRSVPLSPTSSSDLMRCISRANAAAAGRDPSRRVVLVASSMSLESGRATVRGDLATTRIVMVLGWGPDFDARDRAWRSTWASAGAESNLFVYDVADGSGGPLRTAIGEVLR